MAESVQRVERTEPLQLGETGVCVANDFRERCTYVLVFDMNVLALINALRWLEILLKILQSELDAANWVVLLPYIHWLRIRPLMQQTLLPLYVEDSIIDWDRVKLLCNNDHGEVCNAQRAFLEWSDGLERFEYCSKWSALSRCDRGIYVHGLWKYAPTRSCYLLAATVRGGSQDLPGK